MRHVLGFDSWTGGAAHYIRLLPALDARGIRLTLIHIGSWGNEPDCPSEQLIDGLLVRDIKYYGCDSFENVLEAEKPDAVILLSTDTFAHRAFIRYCNRRNIPTLNLYHGMVAGVAGHYSLTNSGQAGKLKISRLAQFRYVLSKIEKLTYHTLPCYIVSLLKTGATFRDWVRFIYDLTRLAYGTDLQVGRAAADATTTSCAVYVREDAEHAVQCYGFSAENVFVVGNPDLIKFGIDPRMLGSWASPPNNLSKSIMYIETGYSSVGVCYSGTEGFLCHLLETARCLATQGFKMKVKLKPNQVNTKTIETWLRESNIDIVNDDVFISELFACSACITEATTVGVIPALIGMPLLLAQYGDLASLSFGSIFLNYPRSYPLHNVADVSSILIFDSAKYESDKRALSQWIDMNVGPLPSGKMPDRVVDIVGRLIDIQGGEENGVGAI